MAAPSELEIHVEPLPSRADVGEILVRLADLPGVAALDSGGGGPHGMTSLVAVGGEPVVTWTGCETHAADAPFEAVRNHLGRWRCERHPRWPFTGGLVGWFGYDARVLLEQLPDRHGRAPGLPLIHLLAVRVSVLRDERTGHLELVRLEDPADPSAVQATRELAEQVTRRVLDPDRNPGPPRGPVVEAENLTLPSRELHLERVRRAQAHIAAGDVYQVNLAHRFEAPRPRDLIEFYRRLRVCNPPSFGAFMTYGNDALLSVSPERFLRCDGDLVETRPIKGTAPRSVVPSRDRVLAEQLLASEKDRAELAMIVDILRNDLSRVCRAGTVKVTDPLVLETYPTVHHLVSNIAGRLQAGRDVVHLLQATLPGGSITGAPRIRAMELIDELEACRRGVYCGAAGYLGYDGRMDLNILIRTATTSGDRLCFHGGGGIVADSDPVSEYQETLHKVKGILEALVGS